MFILRYSTTWIKKNAFRKRLRGSNGGIRAGMATQPGNRRPGRSIRILAYLFFWFLNEDDGE